LKSINDTFAVGTIAGGNLTGETPVHAVVFEEMRIGRDGAEVIDRDDLNVLALGLVRRAQDQPANAAKAVDRNSDCHEFVLSTRCSR
jgi:hypothetical protein